ncbi:DUF72 domain-containing protein [Paenibacillus barcinonensis]|uniref:DUF72 domain-containing protein n=1 Tax=Paenibacillus barcinonensis TaxID=198119 RepID=A0A2V4VHU8_PAEBA|nr:DUF72 domain-containing protein [Paenibacillus barcinonensis]PYE44490.1 uncharacterized protein YecE (DUF72 family) [Paenibacillus barcinonensis]QKS56828.1 DUF72 domain-containing protein [Paenibacillus barcinonensis]
MIRIGLTGWGDQDDLYPNRTKAKDKLQLYSQYFSTVEVDSSFYAVQPRDRMARWAAETPDSFSFIVKAYQGMTGHLRGKPYFNSTSEMYKAFRESLEPVIEAGKMQAALFQYPPWFECNRDNVNELREVKLRMEGIPCAIEFRHRSWYEDKFRERTLAFLKEQGWIHSVCDEPQAGPGSIPIVPIATDPHMTLVRMHGRNVSGWHQNGAPNWRETRYLYRYNEQELLEWRGYLQQLQAQSEDVFVIFNNNSAGDAAANAQMMMELLGQPIKPFPDRTEPEKEEGPEQLELF